MISLRKMCQLILTISEGGEIIKLKLKRGAVLQKQEPYITGANLERAKKYLKALNKEKERLDKLWRSNKSVSPLFTRAWLRYEGAREMFLILAGSEKTSKEIYRKVCGGEWKEDI